MLNNNFMLHINSLFLNTSTSLNDHITWVGFVSLGITIVAILFTIKGNKLLKKLKEQVVEMRGTANQIADYTRKPLIGIHQVLFQMHKMLKYHVDHSEFYFLGFTLGIGPAHDVTIVRDDWDKDFAHENDYLPFKDMYKVLHDNLDKTVKSASKAHVVYLNQKLVENEFIKPLYEIRYKETCPSNLITDIGSLHSAIETRVKNNRDCKVITIETLPIQVLLTKIKKGTEEKFAVVVFHIGSVNVGSSDVLGFYSEAENICELFKGYVKTLC